MVSVGNAGSFGVADYLDHLGDDPETAAVLLYIESVEDEARFVAIARRVAAAQKPVVALIGRLRTGAGLGAAAAGFAHRRRGDGRSGGHRLGQARRAHPGDVA